MTLYAELCAALRDDGRAMLATIVRASGSTPAPESSMMIVRASPPYRTSGSIGGGCLDENIVWSVKEHRERMQPRFFTFNLNDPVNDTGLTCGGSIDVLLEPLAASALPAFEDLATAQESGEDRILATYVPHASASEHATFDANGLPRISTISQTRVMRRVAGLAEEFAGEACRATLDGGECSLRRITAAPSLIVFGGGHVGSALVRIAAVAGFRVTLVDDRPAYASKERSPEAHRIVCMPFAKAIDECEIGPSTHVVIVTRGHKHDERILERVITLSPRYLGMIGSRRKVAVTNANLRERGIADALLAGIHAPVGLDIGARTPGEIAVSIVAELIQERAKSSTQEQRSPKIQAATNRQA